MSARPQARAVDKSVAQQGDHDWWSRYLNSPEVSVPDDAFEVLEKVQDRVKEEPHLMWHRGEVGEHLVHWAALLAGDSPGTPSRAKAILHWIIESQPISFLNSVYDSHAEKDVDPIPSYVETSTSSDEKQLDLPQSEQRPPSSHSRHSPTSQSVGRQERGPYDGEGLVHLCIIKRDMVTLQKLLERDGVLFDLRAYGSFFDAGSPTYFGEYPLSFAAATGWIEGIELMKRYIDSGKSGHGNHDKKLFVEMLTWEDSWGNAPLHHAVLNRRKKMYTWLRANGDAAITQKNCIGLTPVSLAAVVNDASMFEHVLQDMYQVKWSFGPVTCFRLPLEQIETVVKKYEISTAEDAKGAREESSVTTTADEKEFRSVLEIILMQWCGSLVVHPLIMELLVMKWARYGRYIFYSSCVVQISYLFCLTALSFTYTRASEKTASLNALELIVFLITQAFWAGMILDIIAGYVALRNKMQLVGDETKAVIKPSETIAEAEWRKMLERGRIMTGKMMRRDVMPVSVYDYLAWCGQLLITIHYIIYCVEPTGRSQASVAFLSIGVVFSWQCSMQMCLAFKHFGSLVIIIMRVLAKDIPSFMLFLLISCAGFSQGLRLLGVDGMDDFDNDVSNFLYGLLTLFRVLLGEKPTWTQYSGISQMGSLGWIAATYYLVFSATVTIVLLRLMISMFNETYGGVKKVAEEEWRLTWGQMILRGERRLKLLLPREYHYFMSMDNPDENGCSYVFQRVDYDKFNSEKPDGLVGAVQLSPRSPNDSMRAVLAALERQEVELAALRRQVGGQRVQPVSQDAPSASAAFDMLEGLMAGPPANRKGPARATVGDCRAVELSPPAPRVSSPVPSLPGMMG